MKNWNCFDINDKKNHFFFQAKNLENALKRASKWARENLKGNWRILVRSVDGTESEVVEKA